MNNLIRWLSLIGFFFSSPFVYANSEEEELSKLYGDAEFISLATGSRQAVNLAPAVTSVITSADIEAMGAVELDEVLETAAGIHVSYSSISWNPIYIIRGVHSEFNPQVLVLINGIPITQLLYGNRGQAWGGMPVNNQASRESNEPTRPPISTP